MIYEILKISDYLWLPTYNRFQGRDYPRALPSPIFDFFEAHVKTTRRDAADSVVENAKNDLHKA